MNPAFRSLGLVLLTVFTLAAARHHGPVAATAARVTPGFEVEAIAHIEGPRELAATPGGDLLVGTNGSDIFIVPGAEGSPATPQRFAHVPDSPAAGVALGGDVLYIGSQFAVWRVPYHAGDRAASAEPRKIAAVRTSGVSSDHVTTSVAVAGGRLYASVGSSCNACDPDLDATRASIQAVDPGGSGIQPRAIHIRNAIALAVEPSTQQLWAGVAGQDELQHGHPYEVFDAVTAHAGVADYGWPHCYERHRPVEPGRSCEGIVVPRVVFPAYETPVGAVFYPAQAHGRYAFPASYRGGAFVALHGSWHKPLVPPRVAFVPMHDGEPQHAVDWNDPGTQWREFASGFQTPAGERTGRPTGIAVGSEGSLFFADDVSGTIFRVRPVR